MTSKYEVFDEDTFGIVGIAFDEAKVRLAEQEVKYRIRMLNGVPQIGTCDYRPERLNLWIEDNIVKGYYRG